MGQKALKIIIALVAAGAAAQSRGASVDFLEFARGSESVHYALGGPNAAASGNVRAGGFLTTLDGSPSFTSYCVDLYQFISFSDPAYTEYNKVGAAAHAFANAGAAADLARLHGSAHPVSTSVAQAAFQLAVWEIVYETTGTYQLGSGSATFHGNTTGGTAAVDLANTWLGQLGSGSGVAVTVLESRLHQDVAYATPVPEPGTYALMLAGLAGLGAIARKRRRPAR